jgi:hypothetical protein
MAFFSNQLKRAADLVSAELKRMLKIYPNNRPCYQDLALFYSYMLLAGLSLESLTKGIFIGRHPEVVGPDSLDLNSVVKGNGGHDLPSLLRQVDTPSQDELELAARLSKFVKWAGRYPISLKAKDSVYPSFGTSDFDAIEGLFQRLVHVLHKENPESTVGSI